MRGLWRLVSFAGWLANAINQSGSWLDVDRSDLVLDAAAGRSVLGRSGSSRSAPAGTTLLRPEANYVPRRL